MCHKNNFVKDFLLGLILGTDEFFCNKVATMLCKELINIDNTIDDLDFFLIVGKLSAGY